MYHCLFVCSCGSLHSLASVICLLLRLLFCSFVVVCVILFVRVFVGMCMRFFFVCACLCLSMLLFVLFVCFFACLRVVSLVVCVALFLSWFVYSRMRVFV